MITDFTVLGVGKGEWEEFLLRALTYVLDTHRGQNKVSAFEEFLSYGGVQTTY